MTRNSIFILLASTFLLTCSNRKTNTIRKIKIGEYTLVGDISKDSIFQGTVSYFNKNNVLVAKKSFINSTFNGYSVNYYLNGGKKDETNFLNGKENGYTSLFDSLTHNIIYRNFYYFGKLIGPSYYYYPNGKVSEYYFSNFEGDVLFSSSYDSMGNFKGMTDQYFRMNVQDVMAGNNKTSNLFLYNLQPPLLEFRYRLCIEDDNRKIIDTVELNKKNPIYFERLLPELPKGSHYCIVLNNTDPATGTQHVFIREILSKL